MVPNRAKHYAGSSCIVDDDIGGVLYLLQKEHKKRITTWYNLAVILLTLQNSPRRNCMPEHFLRPLSCVTGTPLWLLRPVKVSTSSKLYPDTRLLFFFFFLNAQASSFLVHSHVTYGTLCHARGHSRSYLGKRRIFLGVTGILSMCLRSHT